MSLLMFLRRIYIRAKGFFYGDFQKDFCAHIRLPTLSEGL